MNNNVFVIDENIKNELISKGYKCVDKRNGINGETVWVLNPCGLFFDINDAETVKNVCFDTDLKLTF